VQSVLIGTSKGNASLNGETLREEIDEQFFSSAEWDIKNQKEVSFESTKLYGGQQFERLFSEFRSITKNLKLDASDATSLPSISDRKFLYSACELACSKSEDLLVPLIEQLIERSIFVMKRIPNIAENMLDHKVDKNPNQKLLVQSVIDTKHFLPLATHLKDLFNTFVERTANICKRQCMEEFYSTKTVVWHMSTVMKIEESNRDEAATLSEVFQRLRDRICKNILRKVYNFFLAPFMHVELWDEIQAHFFVVDKAHLDEILEVTTIEDYLDNQLEIREVALEKLFDDEATLQDLVPKL